MIQISVIGNDGDISGDLRDVCIKLGEELAKKGATLVCGGRGGVMAATAEGAKRAGGLTVGIIDGGNKEEANSYVDVCIPTSMGYARNALVVKSGDAVIAVGGRVGTLSEIGLAMACGKSVIGIRGTGGVVDLLLDHDIGGYKLIEAKTVEEAVNAAFRFSAER